MFPYQPQNTGCRQESFAQAILAATRFGLYLSYFTAGFNTMVNVTDHPEDTFVAARCLLRYKLQFALLSVAAVLELS